MTRPIGYDALPKRFKTYIDDLESQLRTLAMQVPARKAVQGTQLKLVDRLYQGNDGYLSDDTEFAFLIGTDEFRVKAARNHGVDGVEVSSPSGPLVVHPRVSNVVVIGAAP